jgi:Fe-S oxidoreductase
MYQLQYDPEICARCQTFDCFVRCQYMDLDLEEARQERHHVLRGEDCRVLNECVTCYACEEYCPHGNHPFYQIVDRQEQLKIRPVPIPLTTQQVKMMAPRRQIVPLTVQTPVINMCYFPMLLGCVRGRLFEGASVIVGSDIFCNIMWLHFAKSSVIRERLPQVIQNIENYYLKESGVNQLVCFHDECYGTYTHLAPSFGIEVPFKPVHLFEYLTKKLTQLKSDICPINKKVAYQRPCSNRLIPETQHWVDEIFGLIGVDRVEREHDRDNALCCGMTIRAMQRDDLADDIQKRNLDDMESVGAEYCVFNCPACFFAMKQVVAKRGMTPILMSELCQMALGE